ncbi:methyltransferase domain-containing protein [bacterium]|nr:methyltransferase domain-containing protein [bacterium]MBU1651413.1 methyltransferase domain-containing protein [bacterium]MBU1882069.1 methyltransferase domain-containing protein [bacterium]
MEYDRVKDRLQTIIGDSPLLRSWLFAALDRLFLRSRYVAREIGRLKSEGFNPEYILDAGSGFGQYTVRLAKSFPDATVIGLDVMADRIASGNRFAARANLKNLKFETGDLTRLEYNGQFDLIVSVDVMEHIEEDQLALQNIARALKPGGLFIMTTPWWDGGETPLAKIFIDEHVRPGYTEAETYDKFTAAGMTVKRFEITYGKWGSAAWKLLQKWPMSCLKGRFWMMPVVFLYFIIAYPIAWICMQMDLHADNIQGGGILAIAHRDSQGTES